MGKPKKKPCDDFIFICIYLKKDFVASNIGHFLKLYLLFHKMS